MEKQEKYYFIAYEPFQKEAEFCFAIDIIISAGVAILFWALKLFSSIFFCMIIPLFFLIEIIINYRIAILSWLEYKKGLFISTEICIKEIHDDYSASGRWDSIISRIYPPNLRVSRYRVVGKDSTGTKVNLRCAISGKKWQLIHDSLSEEGWDRLVTYGKLSHVILSFDDRDEFSFIYNRNI